MVGGEPKIGFRFPRSIGRAKAEILVEPIGFNQLAGIHLPFWIPRRFELPESLDQFRAEHFRQQLCARLTVAMFARDGAAIAHYQIGSFLHKFAKLSDTFFRLQIEVNASVDATVPEVCVERALIAISSKHAAQIANISAEF